MGTHTERRVLPRPWLVGCALGGASFLVTLLVMRGGAVADEPVRVLSWQSAAAVASAADARSPRAVTSAGDVPDSWQEDCAEECGAPEPVPMSPEEALELRAEEDALFAALQQEATLE
jgi:hypothetical protein